MIYTDSGIDETVVDLELTSSPATALPPTKSLKRSLDTTKETAEANPEKLSYGHNEPTSKQPNEGIFRVPGAPRSAQISGTMTNRKRTLSRNSSTQADSLTSLTNPVAEIPAVAVIRKTKAIKAAKDNRPPFCCAALERSEPNCLFTCDNKSCQQRQLSLLFAEEMKSKMSGVPLASLYMVNNNKYMIQALKYIPKPNLELVTSSRLKKVSRATETSGNNAANKWMLDKSFGGEYGRFYLELFSDKFTPQTVVPPEDGQPIWYEIHGMGVGAEGLRQLGGYSREDESLVAFECEFHDEERWVCVLWKKGGKDSKSK